MCVVPSPSSHPSLTLCSRHVISPTPPSPLSYCRVSSKACCRATTRRPRASHRTRPRGTRISRSRSGRRSRPRSGRVTCGSGTLSTRRRRSTSTTPTRRRFRGSSEAREVNFFSEHFRAVSSSVRRYYADAIQSYLETTGTRRASPAASKAIPRQNEWRRKTESPCD
jgi:hypothetical protein